MSALHRDREAQFHDLVTRVKACRRCPRMADSARVLGAACGPLDAPIMFVGEAPGRLGADVSELPFHGDVAGHNFERLIEQVGISRYDAFVTNAVLCNPRSEDGRNAPPSKLEVMNCAPFLAEQIDLLQPKIVATLGAVALRAASIVEPHRLELRVDVRTGHEWHGRKLVPLYHPGQRAMVHRSFGNQLADYQFVAELLFRGRKKKTRTARAKQSAPDMSVRSVAKELLRRKRSMSYFALHKLLFLAEVRHLERTGTRLTSGYIIRQKDGPYCVDLHIARLAKIPGIQVTKSVTGSLRLSYAQQDSLIPGVSEDEMSAEAIATVELVISRYGSLADGDLKRVVYLSSPMRSVLRREKHLGVNMFNAPLLPQSVDRM